jgi:hypothetical protein
VNHLDIVTRSSLANPIAARVTVNLCSGLLEDLLDCWPSCGTTAGHKGRTIACSLFTARDTGTDKEEALVFTFLCAADGVRVVRVATIDDDVPFVEVRCQLSDEIIDSRPSLHKEDDFARALEL